MDQLGKNSVAIGRCFTGNSDGVAILVDHISV
jgi:hypothetical protein